MCQLQCREIKMSFCSRQMIYSQLCRCYIIKLSHGHIEWWVHMTRVDPWPTGYNCTHTHTHTHTHTYTPIYIHLFVNLLAPQVLHAGMHKHSNESNTLSVWVLDMKKCACDSSVYRHFQTWPASKISFGNLFSVFLSDMHNTAGGSLHGRLHTRNKSFALFRWEVDSWVQKAETGSDVLTPLWRWFSWQHTDTCVGSYHQKHSRHIPQCLLCVWHRFFTQIYF